MTNLTSLQMFSNPLFKVRVVMRVSKPWFVAKDVAECIDHKDVSTMCKLCRDGDKVVVNFAELKHSANIAECFTGQQSPNLTLISESGLYRILAKCNLPKCEPFENWVFDEVLPSIRQKGYYSLQERNQEQEETHKNTLPAVSEEDHFFLKILHAESTENTALALRDYKIYRDELQREVEQERDEAVRKRKAINDKRTATLMVAKREDNKKISQLTCENTELKEQNEELQKEKDRLFRSFGCTPEKHDWLTVSVMRDIWQRNFKKEPQWQDLKRIIKENDLVEPIKDVIEIVNNKEHFVNRYPRRAWEIYFDEELASKNQTEE